MLPPLTRLRCFWYLINIDQNSETSDATYDLRLAYKAVQLNLAY